MNGQDDRQKRLNCNCEALVVKVTFSLEGGHGDEDYHKDICGDTVVYTAHTGFEGRESEKFLSGPNLVNSVGKFNFFLLNSLLVVHGRDLILVDVREKLHAVQHSHQVCTALESFNAPVVNLSILFAVDESHSVTLTPELTRGWPGHIEKQRHKKHLH